MNLKGEPATVGRHCGGHAYTVTPEMVAFYADALDDACAAEAKSAPPLIFHSECYAVLGEWYLQNLFGNLHAQQDWELFAPVPVGEPLVTRSTIIDRYPKRGRDYVVNETDLMRAADHQLLVRGRTHQSFLPKREKADAGQGDGFVVDAGTAKKKAPRAAFPTASGPDLPAVTKTVDERRCWMFSGPGRNYHTDRDAAKQLGFPNIVVQGMMGTCFVSEVMQARFGDAWLAGGRMSVKLTNVLWVDERVTAHARVREERPEGTRTRVVCDVWVEKDDGVRTHLGEASATTSNAAA